MDIYLFKLTKRVIELKGLDFAQLFDWLGDSFSEISRSQVDERVEFPELGSEMRKAKENRKIDEDWY